MDRGGGGVALMPYCKHRGPDGIILPSETHRPSPDYAAGPVVEYRLSEEELARYRARRPERREKRPLNLAWRRATQQSATKQTDEEAVAMTDQAVPKPVNRRWTEEEVAEIRRLASEGLLDREIAERFGVPRTIITQVRYRYGIERAAGRAGAATVNGVSREAAAPAPAAYVKVEGIIAEYDHKLFLIGQGGEAREVEGAIAELVSRLPAEARGRRVRVMIAPAE